MRIATSPRIFSPTLIYSHALQVSSPYITLSLENMVFGCSSRVRDLHVRLAKAVRHISFRSEDHRHKQEQKSKSIFFRIKMETVQRLDTPLTCLLSQEVGISAVMTHIAVEHIIGHEWKAVSVGKMKKKKINTYNFTHMLYKRFTLHTPLLHRCNDMHFQFDHSKKHLQSTPKLLFLWL